MNGFPKTLAVLSLALLATASHAAIEINVYVAPLDGRYLQPDGVTPVNSNYTLEIGVINGFTFQEFLAMTPQEQAQAAVTAVDTFVGFSGPFNFEANGNMDLLPAYFGARPGAVGEQLYTKVVNALGEIGIFTADNPFWQIGDDGSGGPTPLSQLFLDAGTPYALVGSIDGIDGVLANQVPEPSTYAFIAGLATLGLVAYRRRQRA